MGQQNAEMNAMPASKKGKRSATSQSAMLQMALTDLFIEPYDELGTPTNKRTKKNAASSSTSSEEKRLRRFRSKPPQSYLEKLERATTQRMFVINRTRGGTDDTPEETIEMAGSTGNIYSIAIGLEPKCTCPDNRKGNQCKHIIYVLHNVLKAPEDLQYQLALLSNELREIFAAAPLPPSAQAEGSTDSNRKAVEGDCRICFTDFSPETEEIVYCKAACGNNIHASCFEQWARTQSGHEIRCVYCRTPWQGDEETLKRIGKDGGKLNEEGYVNVAGELGLSGARDYSSYHPFWVRRRFQYG